MEPRPTSRKRRRKSRGRLAREQLTALKERLQNHSTTRWLLTASLATPVLLLGAVPPGALLAVACLTFFGVFFFGDVQRTPRLALACAFLGAYCLLQCVPLPLELLEAIAPHNAEVWRESLVVATGHAPTSAPLSIDPAASLRAGLAWLYYAAVVLLATRSTQREGLQSVLFAVFSSTAMIAVITLAHGLVGAERIYGIVERSFDDSQWALSPLVNSNNLAGYLNLGFFSGASLLVAKRSTPQRIAIALGTILMAGLSLTSGSRGALGTWILGVLSAAVIALVQASRSPRREEKSSLGYLAALPLLIVALVAATVPEMALRTLDDKSMDKVHMISWVAPLIGDHLWFGVGAGAFEAGFLPYRHREDGVVWTHPENIVVGWLAELGLPVTVLLLLGVGYLFWRRRGQRFGAPRAIAAVGLGMWFVHNLFDLAVIVPGILAAVLALLAAVTEPSHGRAIVPTSRPRSQRWPKLVLATSGLTLAGTVGLFAMRTSAQDRAALHAGIERVEATGKLPDHFFAHLEGAVRRHPGDAYLFRLGAVAANFDPQQSPYRWLGRALDRDMTSAETHLLLARQLVRSGAVHQALMEYRLAAERSLSGTIVDEVIALTRDDALLSRVVPQGRSGSQMLVELGKRISRDTDPEFRLALFERAVARDPENVAAKLLLTDDLLRFNRSDPKTCAKRSPPCSGRIDALLVQMKANADLSATDAQRRLHLEATWRAQRGDAESAVRSLLEQCPRSEPGCLELAVSLSVDHELPLERPTKYYLAVACPGEASCVNARRALARAHAARSHWGAALEHYREAAKLSNAATDYLSAARMALHSSALPEVRRLLDQLNTATPRPTVGEQQAAREVEQQLIKASRILLLPDPAD